MGTNRLGTKHRGYETSGKRGRCPPKSTQKPTQGPAPAHSQGPTQGPSAGPSAGPSEGPNLGGTNPMPVGTDPTPAGRWLDHLHYMDETLSI